MTRDYKHSRVNETKASAYWIVAGIVAIIALLAVMGERDREHEKEVELLTKVVHSQAMEILSMKAADCAPAMDMPIDVGRVQL